MSSDSVEHECDLDALFPPPTLPPSSLIPQRFPGTNVESLATLLHVLKDNHKRWHIFRNEIKFHNHVTHRALALYALGGSGAVIKDLYERDSQAQRPVVKSPGIITADNFVDHLGNENYYQAYFHFFSKEINANGVSRTLEEYIFSEKFNTSGAGNHPGMLSRFVGGLLHALIHVGHGLEFGLKGMLVQGLALTAVHDPDPKLSLSYLPFTFTAVKHALEETARLFSCLALDGKPVGDSVCKAEDTHVFDILARVQNDDELQQGVQRPSVNYRQVTADWGDKIGDYVRQWTIDMTNAGEIERKTEELIWMSCVLYAVGGYSESKGFVAEFFMMHLVTSSLFLHTLGTSLTPRSQVLLLRAYLSVVLTWWVTRGFSALNIRSFMASTTTQPSIPAPKTNETQTNTKTLLEDTSNPFFPILQSSISHPDDHMPKIQRTLAHFSTLYGTRPAGYFKGTELDGAELLDGSLFVRAAILTGDYMGWVHEGQPAGSWEMA